MDFPLVTNTKKFLRMEKISKSILKRVYRKRKTSSHKGDYGNVLIVAGSNIYSGSAIFNALSALAVLKSGTDLVEVVSVKRCANIIAAYSPDLITIPLKGEYLEKKHVREIFKHSENKDAFLIGGGLGRNKKTLSVVHHDRLDQVHWSVHQVLKYLGPSQEFQRC